MFTTLISSLLFLIGATLTALSVFISEKFYFDREKSSPFECGFNPMATSRLPFSLRFFVIAVIFLIFDVEIVLLLPMSSSWEVSGASYWILTYLVFLAILLIGTIYEWSYGALSWKS
uniref:NADH-ubiquinone oxidoreductase chain 3 n=1 Tax=Proasellus hercegovinensis TaxID=1281977 RepID=A0A485M8V9_9CRUS|nr:NADH dehydrogenase subunit 3 [Proasellus hercegovinensis]